MVASCRYLLKMRALFYFLGHMSIVSLTNERKKSLKSEKDGGFFILDGV